MLTKSGDPICDCGGGLAIILMENDRVKICSNCYLERMQAEDLKRKKPHPLEKTEA